MVSLVDVNDILFIHIIEFKLVYASHKNNFLQQPSDPLLMNQTLLKLNKFQKIIIILIYSYSVHLIDRSSTYLKCYSNI